MKPAPLGPSRAPSKADKARGRRIQLIRLAVGESTTDFGKRFARKRGAVTDWEYGGRNPDKLVWQMLELLEKTHVKKIRKLADSA